MLSILISPETRFMYFFVWKKYSDDAKIVILHHQRFVWAVCKDYSQ